LAERVRLPSDMFAHGFPLPSTRHRASYRPVSLSPSVSGKTRDGTPLLLADVPGLLVLWCPFISDLRGGLHQDFEAAYVTSPWIYIFSPPSVLISFFRPGIPAVRNGGPFLFFPPFQISVLGQLLRPSFGASFWPSDNPLLLFSAKVLAFGAEVLVPLPPWQNCLFFTAVSSMRQDACMIGADWNDLPLIEA